MLKYEITTKRQKDSIKRKKMGDEFFFLKKERARYN